MTTLAAMTAAPRITTDPAAPRRRRLRMMAVFGDYEGGKRAQAACRELTRLTQDEAGTSWDSWESDMLKLRAMRDLGVQSAADTSLLVLAPGADGVLPPWVMDWVRASLAFFPHHPKALLVLPPEDAVPGAVSARMERQIRELAACYEAPCWFLDMTDAVAEADKAAVLDKVARMILRLWEHKSAQGGKSTR